ncbi:MAG TPA: hypothetical protein PKY35_06765 [Candidatus Hydrogenedentes bacterium]|nr:hypothetical protein [Candidatus Hydrogenedentota bacterium]HOL76715.1 hypothetical protein [Candidatus Hydrogenedentota bacterium]HPO85324.1 hypothetical protein [Candidatus Hydrogenedentota bacterium]
MLPEAFLGGIFLTSRYTGRTPLSFPALVGLAFREGSLPDFERLDILKSVPLFIIKPCMARVEFIGTTGEDARDLLHAKTIRRQGRRNYITGGIL